MGKIIAIANQKGGVAKTTTTHNLGTGLAKAGYKVLIVDLDSQASLTISMGIEPSTITKNINYLLKNENTEENVKECIHVVENNKNLSIITSDISLASLEMELLSRTSREKILTRALEKIKNNYDFILIDCPPQLAILTINALSCADSVIIPSSTDYLSYRGLQLLIDTIETVKQYINTELEIIGIVATLYKMVSKDDKEILEGMKKNYNVIGVIKNLVSAKNGIYDGKSALEMFPESEIAIAYENLSQYVINKYHKE